MHTSHAACMSVSAAVLSPSQQAQYSLQAEKADHKAHTPHAAPLSPQIYGLGVQQRVESIRANATAVSRGGMSVVRDPALMECTFRPQTNFGLRRKARPGSAPKQQPLPAAFDLSEYEDLLARYGLPMCSLGVLWCARAHLKVLQNFLLQMSLVCNAAKRHCT